MYLFPKQEPCQIILKLLILLKIGKIVKTRNFDVIVPDFFIIDIYWKQNMIETNHQLYSIVSSLSN